MDNGFTVARQKAGFSTKMELAIAVSTSPANISRWENGNRFPRRNAIHALSSALKLPEREIVQILHTIRS